MVVNITEVITDENGLTYEINNNDFKARIIKSPKVHGDLLIKRVYYYRNWKIFLLSDDSEISEIIQKAFSNSAIKSIEIPSHVKQISEFTFSNCKQLKAVTFSRNSELLRINQNAFSYSSIENINIPPHAKLVDEFSLLYCTNLKSFTFSESSELLTIEKYAFIQSALENINIPSCLKKSDHFASRTVKF